MKTSIRSTLVAVAAVAAGIAAAPAFSQQSPAPATPSASQDAPQAAPQPGTGGMGCMGGMGMQGGPGMQGGRGMGGPGMHGGHGMHRGQGMHGGQGMRGGERMALRADANGDGRLGRDELQAAQKARAERALQAFDAADTDKDGMLTVEERRAFRDSMRAQAGGQPGAHRHGGAWRAPADSPAPARPAAPTTPGA
jgi:hypothetical protein